VSLAEALDRLRATGCSWAAPPYDRVTDVGLRRWLSFERRNKQRGTTREDRIHDLATGLYHQLTPPVYRFASDPTMRDVECVARTIAAVVDPDSQSTGERAQG